MIKDIYYQRGAPDPVLKNDTVLSIVRQFIPAAKEVNYVDETGGEARVYAVDSDIILKVQRPQQLRLSTSLKKEAFFLGQLENLPDINVPKVLGYGKLDTIEYTCMTRMPGIAVKYADLSAGQREKMLYDLGKMLFLIHNVNIKAFYESGFFPDIDKGVDDIKERLKVQFDWGVYRLSEKLSEAQKTKIHAAAAEQINRITEVCIVPCHSNPSPPHVFVDGNKFTGIIDFGDAYISHPVFDIRRWPFADRAALVAGYTSHGKTGKDFCVVYEVSLALDKMINDLSK